MLRIKNSLILFVIFFLLPFLVKAEPLKIFIEDFPPYNYQENRKLKGTSVEIVNKILIKAEIKAEIILTSWTRCLNDLGTSKDPVAVFSMVMNEKRKPLYKWVGLLNSIEISFFPHKNSRYNFKNIDEIMKSKLTVSVCNKCASHDFLLKIKFPEKQIDQTYKLENIGKKLYYKRVNFVLMRRNTFIRNAKMKMLILQILKFFLP